MEKYLIIFLIAIVGYVIWICLTENKEGFADAQTIDGVDDNNAINTLAKIAKDLQEGGGLKVKGNLLVDGDIRNTNANITKGPDQNRYIFHTPNDARKGMWIVPAKDDAASDWLWSGGLNLNRNGNHIIGGNLEISGVTNKAVNVWHTSKDGKNRVYYENGSTSYYGSGNGNHIFRLGGDGNGAEVVIRNDGKIIANSRDIIAELNALRDDVNKLRGDLDDRTRYIIRQAGWGLPPGYSWDVNGGAKIDGNGHANWAWRP